MSEFFEGMDKAMEVGVDTAKAIVTIANTSDMEDIREDATGEAIRRLMFGLPKEWWNVALAETVKTLSIALSMYSDELQGKHR